MLAWLSSLGCTQEGSRMAESHEQTVIYPETGLLDSQELIGEA